MKQKYTIEEHIFQPYLTLEDCIEGPLNAYGPSLSFKRLLSGEDTEVGYLLVQRVMPAGFRHCIGDLLEEKNYSEISPLSVPEEKRSKRWSVFCNYIEDFNFLPCHQQHAVCHVLITLGYYELTYILLHKFTGSHIYARADISALAYMRAFARFMLCIKSPYYKPEDVACIAEQAPVGSVARFASTLRMLVYHARFLPDVEAVEHWRREAELASKALPLSSNSFEYCIVWSRFWRAASYLYWLKSDRERANHEMNFALEYALKAKWRTEEERVLWRANLYPVIQSQARIAEETGDKESAYILSQKLVEIDPWYSNAHLDLANSLFQLNNIESAARAYQLASFLGPPVNIIATFLAGYCYELLGYQTIAKNFYVKALNLDKNGASSVERIKQLKNHLSIKPIKDLAVVFSQ